MAKVPFLTKTEPGKRKWLTNFIAKLPTYAGTVGISGAEQTIDYTSLKPLLNIILQDGRPVMAQTGRSRCKTSCTCRPSGLSPYLPRTPRTWAN